MTDTTCTEMENLIQLKLDGELDPAGAETLERHLAVCAHCRAVSEQYDSLNDSLLFHIRVEDAVPDFVPQPSFMEKLAETLGRIPAFFERTFSLQPRYQLAMATVAVVLLVVAVPMLRQPDTAGPDGPPVTDAGNITACAFSVTTVKAPVSTGGSLETMTEIKPGETRSLADGDHIVTGYTGSVELAYNTSSTVRVHSGSEVKLGQGSIDITRGHVWMDHRDGGIEFSSPSARLGVMGTIFGMKVRTDGRTTAYCEDGQIWVMGTGDTAKTFVAAGQQVTVSADGLAGTVVPFKPEKQQPAPVTHPVTTTKPDTSAGRPSGTHSAAGETSLQVDTNTLLLDIVDNTDLIYALYRQHHRRNPKKDELNTLLKALETGDYTREDISRAVTDQEFYREIVQTLNR